jgi:hypothetical protein
METKTLDRAMTNPNAPQLGVRSLRDHRLTRFQHFVSKLEFTGLDVNGNNSIAVPLFHQWSNLLLV